MLRILLSFAFLAAGLELPAAAQIGTYSPQSAVVTAGSLETVTFQVQCAPLQTMVYGLALSTDSTFDCNNVTGNVWVAYSGGVYDSTTTQPGYWVTYSPKGIPLSQGGQAGFQTVTLSFRIPIDAPGTIYLHLMVHESGNDLCTPDDHRDIPLTVVGMQDPKWDLQMQDVTITAQYEQWGARIINRGVWPVRAADLKVVGWVYESKTVTAIAESGFTCSLGDNSKQTNYTQALPGVTPISTVTCSASRQADQMVVADLAGLGTAAMIYGSNGYLQSNSIMLRVGPVSGNSSGTWYSTVAGDSTSPTVYTDDPHFGLYFRGQLVCETSSNGAGDPNTGQAPCGIVGCGTHTASPTFTISPTPSISPTQTPSWTITAGPSPTITSTVTPTETITPNETETSAALTATESAVEASWTTTATVTPSVTLTPTETITPNETETSVALTATESAVEASWTTTATVTPSVTLTPTETITPNETETSAALTATESAVEASWTTTATVTPSVTLTHTETITPNETETSAALTATESAVEASWTTTATVTPSASPTPATTASPSHWNPHLILAPVPVVHGGRLTLFSPLTPSSGEWEIYDIAGERVRQLRFGAGPEQWNSGEAASGIYIIHVKVRYASAGSADHWQKVAVIR